MIKQIVLHITRSIIILILLCVGDTAFTQIVFTSEEQEWIKEHPVVYYGYDPSWKPIEFSEGREHVGITSDFCALISERVGFELVPHPENGSWSDVIELFNKKEIPVLTCVSENDERRKTMDFTDGYLSYPFVIVTQKNGRFIGSVKDLQGKTVACPKNYFITMKLETELIKMKILYTENVEQSMMEVTTGNADATVGNLAVISHYLNYSGFENLKIACPTDYEPMELKMGVQKDQPILRQILNKALGTITSKEKNEITQNWVAVTYEHGVNMARVWTIAGISLGIVGLIFGFFVYWNRKLKKEVARRKEAEELLQQSFQEISMQKVLIEEKNEEVLDSIKYAKRLQAAIMPSIDEINSCLPQNFVFYIPKDIVAGDFYWMEKVTDEEGKERVFIAAADCTGHGVPGAMVSVVCSNALNRSLLEYGILDPGQILDKATDLVIERFSKSEDQVKDGMDIGLSSVEYLENGNARIRFAGAHNHLWIITTRKDIGVESNLTEFEGSDYVLHELKATKQPVGLYINRQSFKTWEVELNKGERFYLYSDGFADQFGGTDGKKFKNKTFKKLLVNIAKKSMPEQKAQLEKVFVEWKKDFEQLDDVCVIGVCV